MSFAYSLAASLSATETEEDLTTLVIDHYTRTIRIPKGITTLGVENDDEVLRLNFKMPRYLGTVDLYNFNIRINYINANGDEDVYTVSDKAIDNEDITFSWLVGPAATAYKGSTKFNVCMIVTDANSVIKQEYNTAIASLSVLEGMECSERVIQEYADILAQWERRLFGVSDTEEARLIEISEGLQQNIADKGAEVLATIPKDYQTAVNMADNANRTKADAIICSAEGEAITVHDSADDPLRGLKIFGKTTQITTNGYQLFDASKINSFVSGGVTLINNGDGSFKITGSTISGNAFGAYHDYTHAEMCGLLKAGPLTLKTDRTTYPYVYVMLRKNNVNQVTISNSSLTSHMMTITDTYLADESYTLRIGFFGELDKTITNGAVVKPVLYQDGNGTWEPYSGGDASPRPAWPQEIVSVNTQENNIAVYGKNLLDDTQLVHHPEYTDTYSSALSVINYKVCAGKTYTLSFDTENTGVRMYVNPTSGFTYTQFTMDGKRHSVTTTMEKDVTNSKNTMALVSIATSNGVTCGRISNVQIELGSEATPYEPFRTAQPVTLSERIVSGLPVTSGGNYTDSNGQQWVCDEIDFERGVYVQRLAHYVFDGSVDEPWRGVYRHDTKPYVTIDVLRGRNEYTTPMLCNYALQNTWNSENVCFINNYDELVIGGNPIESQLVDLATFKQHLAETPIEVVYILWTPIETPLTTDELAAFQALTTNCPNTTMLSNAGAWMKLKYNVDTITYINNLHRIIDEQAAHIQKNKGDIETVKTDIESIKSDFESIGLTEVEVQKILIPEQTVVTSSEGGDLGGFYSYGAMLKIEEDINLPLSETTPLIVRINGVDYEAEGTATLDGSFIDPIDADARFALGGTNRLWIFQASTPLTTYTVSVRYRDVTETVMKLPESILPNAVVKSVNGVKPDAYGNVKLNISSGGVFLPETEAVRGEDDLFVIRPIIEGLVVGETYPVRYNGVEYECVAQVYDEADGNATGIVLGNVGAVTGGVSTGEPFVMVVLSPEVAAEEGFGAIAVALDGSTSVTIGIGTQEVFADSLIVRSSTPGSTKKFKITVDDSGMANFVEI